MKRPEYKVIQPIEVLLDRDGNIVGTAEVGEMSRAEILKLYPNSKRLIDGAVKP